VEPNFLVFLGAIIFSLCPLKKALEVQQELLILGSEQPEYQNLCSVVICEYTYHGKLMMDISFPMLLGVTTFGLYAD
jgi:hypothetical protein